MKIYVMIIVAALLGAIATGCDSAEGNPIKDEVMVTAPATKEISAAPHEKENPGYKVGEEVALGDFIIKINKVQSFESTDEFMQPSADKQLIAVEVEYTNRTTGTKVSSNPLDWSASDNEGYSYGYDLMMAKEPLLNRKILNAGGKVKGWITFQIPKTNKLVSVQFQPNLLENENVEFMLQ